MPVIMPANGWDERPCAAGECTLPAGAGRDHLYSVAAITDTTGAVVERYGYSSYGGRDVVGVGADMVWGTADDTFGSVSAIGQPYGFTGRRLDDETGLWYFRARYFDDELGRFSSRDAGGYWDGLSLYRAVYVPNQLDPSGLKITFTYKPDDLDSPPWNWAPGNRPLGGTKTMSLIIKCVCVKCEEGDEGFAPDCDFKLDCTVDLTDAIFLREQAIRDKARDEGVPFEQVLRETYGHEREHLRATKAWTAAVLDMIEPTTDICQWNCIGGEGGVDFDTADWIRAYVQRVLDADKDHNLKNKHGLPGSPPENVGIPVEPGEMPEDPTGPEYPGAG